MMARHHLPALDEKKRYELHNNNPKDQGYLQFLSPITNYITSNFNGEHKGLDFGCGPVPAMQIILKEKKVNITSYDPYFSKIERSAFDSYDFIILCEVMEHFSSPLTEFKFLYQLLHPGGHLICKTNLFSDAINFETWWYKNDPTHVFFYADQSIEFIKNVCNFTTIKKFDDFFVFYK